MINLKKIDRKDSGRKYMEILFMLLISFVSASTTITDVSSAVPDNVYVHIFDKPLLSPPLLKKNFPLATASHGWTEYYCWL